MSKDLKLRNLRLQNWKNFSDINVAIQDRIFLVGPNASGKSNLLDVFRFLRDIASTGGGFQEAIDRRGGVGAIRCLAARRYPDVRIQVELHAADDSPPWEYELGFNQDKQRRPLVRTERVARGGKSLLQRPDREDEKDPARLTQTYLEQVNVNQQFRELATYFASIRYLHLVPQLVRDPDRSLDEPTIRSGEIFSNKSRRRPKRHGGPACAAFRKPCARRSRNFRRSNSGATIAGHLTCAASTSTGVLRGRGRPRSSFPTAHCA